MKRDYFRELNEIKNDVISDIRYLLRNNNIRLHIDRDHLSRRPIINPIPNITIGKVFLLDMSNATSETINGVKCNAIKTYGIYQCICDSISIYKLKAFVISKYFNVIQYNGMLYHTTCKWNGTKPTAFQSKFTDICGIRLTKENVEIQLYNDEKWYPLSEVYERCINNNLNVMFYYTLEECLENNTESIVCFEEEKKEPEKPQVVINIEINNIHKTFNICDVKDVMDFIKSQAY